MFKDKQMWFLPVNHKSISVSAIINSLRLEFFGGFVVYWFYANQKYIYGKKGLLGVGRGS